MSKLSYDPLLDDVNQIFYSATKNVNFMLLETLRRPLLHKKNQLFIACLLLRLALAQINITDTSISELLLHTRELLKI